MILSSEVHSHQHDLVHWALCKVTKMDGIPFPTSCAGVPRTSQDIRIASRGGWDARVTSKRKASWHWGGEEGLGIVVMGIN